MSIDFSEYASDYGRSAMNDQLRETALRQLERRFGDDFTEGHRARVEAANRRQLTQVLDNVVELGFTLDDVLAPLRTPAKRPRKR